MIFPATYFEEWEVDGDEACSHVLLLGAQYQLVQEAHSVVSYRKEVYSQHWFRYWLGIIREQATT